MPLFTIAILAVIAAIVAALAVAIGWTQLHARPNIPAPVGNATRPRRRPF